MQKLSRKNTLFVSLTLFSLFFGAGNLIFPPFLGESSGSHTILSLAGFYITAVCFPIFAVIAISKHRGLFPLASKVHPKFALVFTFLIYLSIGPLLGIPRAGSLPFEMAVAPFLGSLARYQQIGLFLFTFVFFTIAYFISKNPTKLVDRMGKVLTPLLLVLMIIVFVGSFIKPFDGFTTPIGNYQTTPFVQGFLDGYLTMDTIAALNFGLVIAQIIQSLGITEESDVVKNTVRSGLFAGVLLMIVYGSLAYLGALSGHAYGYSEHGAQTLAHIITHIFGPVGVLLLAIIFTLACLTTSVGLITSCSQYFSSKTRYSYKNWVIAISIWSFITSNLGLSKILKISVPLLEAIYPIAMVLIVLSFLELFADLKHSVYKATIGVTTLMSMVSIIDVYVFTNGSLLKGVPLNGQGLAWVVPAVISFVLIQMYHSFKDKKKNATTVHS